MVTIIFLLLNFAHSQDEANQSQAFEEPSSDLTCRMGSLAYTGPYHSESWTYISKVDMSSCRDRQTMDAQGLGERWKENNKKIQTQVDLMMAEPRCLSVKEVLEKYKKATANHMTSYQARQKNRANWMEEFGSTIDVQRNFAYMQGWNSFCSGQYNTKSIFIDMETINKVLPPSPHIIQVKKNGEVVEDCGSIRANGVDNLSNFKVSLKKSKGGKFIFKYDVYGVPDQVILTSSSGKFLLDSGCNSTSQIQVQEFSIKELGSNPFVNVDVKLDCSGNGKGSSAWEIEVACQQNQEDPCKPEKDALRELLKQEVLIDKQFLDINSAEIGCFQHMHETILPGIYGENKFWLTEGVNQNAFCSYLEDETCGDVRLDPDQKKADLNKTQKISHEAAERIPANEPDHCGKHPGDGASLFVKISWNYCKVQKTRLGLD